MATTVKSRYEGVDFSQKSAAGKITRTFGGGVVLADDREFATSSVTSGYPAMKRSH